jgi:heptaprenyl diphosphate synthase
MESTDPADEDLKQILAAPITDEAIVASTIERLRTHKALIQSRELVQRYADEATALLAGLPAGPARAALVELSNAVITRTA